MTAWVINLIGLAVIGLIILWFWLSHPKSLRAAGSQPIEISVADGVYTPARIEVPAGKPITLRFVRRDPSPCADKVMFDSLSTSADLSVNKPTDVTVTPPQPGEYEFTCQMRMYHGALIAK
ncbi:MAG: cupredoxin domain-containing protein [Sulfuricaulis sp.]